MPIINTVIAGGGTTPTGTIQITSNGITDVTNYASADVQVPTTAPALYREFQVNYAGKLMPDATTTHVMDFTNIHDIDDYMLYHAYYWNTAVTGVLDMSGVTKISGEGACHGAFQRCTGLTSVNMSGLTQLTGSNACAYMFEGDTAITSVDFTALTRVGSNTLSYTFKGCTGITSVTFPALTRIDNQGCYLTFQNCTNLTSLSFPAITTSSSLGVNAFNGMCSGVANVTLHFPSNVQSLIEGLNGYSTTAPFGATAGTVLFDLPATS